MLKYLPALFIVASQIPAPSIANSTCSNYWTNPKTGQEECLDLKNGLPTTPAPTSDVEVQPPDTPKGYKFLAQNELGDRFFIKARNPWKAGSRTYSGATVRTRARFKKENWTRYSIWCDRRILTINSDSDIPIASTRNPASLYAGSEGSIGYEIWKAACVREK
ncbi:hypothetical protein ACSQ6I_28215 [Anabaena sp. WFMT]|uniref:hypothetical protein n=1 Tax=Anabaena sp. WFMT TaxID=3449730 RepID=UPI003F1F28D8